MYTQSNSHLNVLSQRAHNIINKFGGVPAILEFYLSGRSFMDIRNSGKKVALELGVFCEHLVQQRGKKSSSTSDTDIDLAMNQYFIRKQLLSKEAKAYLTKIEENFMISLDRSQKKLFLERNFNPYFEFIRNSGVANSVMIELMSFQKEMRSILNFTFEATLEENIIESTESKKSQLYKFSFLFEENFPIEEIENLISENTYIFERFVSVYLKLYRCSTKMRLIINNYFFHEKLYSVKETAALSACSEQSVRISVAKITDEILPEVIGRIMSLSDQESIDLLGYSENKKWFTSEPFKAFTFNGEMLTPNYRLGYYASKIFYNEDYFILDELLKSILEQNRTFNYETEYLFISKNYVEKNNLRELLVFLELEIYEFESIRFEYNLKVLIDRFYKENDIESEELDIDSIYKLIVKIKIPEIDIALRNLKRDRKKELDDRISEIVEAHLIATKQAKRTKEILSILSQKNIQIDRVYLLNTLKNRSDTFVRMGNGLCGLREWPQSKNLQGSILEIVENQLRNSETPLHFSEILQHLEKYREVSKHSIWTNLKLDLNRRFKFFNCSFVGLASKKYDDYWDNIPRLVPAKFLKVYRNEDLSEEIKIKRLIEFGYPEIHARYIMDLKKLRNH